MPALSDPKLERFSQALLVNIAHGMPRSKAAAAAAEGTGPVTFNVTYTREPTPEKTD